MLAFPVAKLESVRTRYQGTNKPGNHRSRSSCLDGRTFCCNDRDGHLLPSEVKVQPGSPMPISAPFLGTFHKVVLPLLTGSDPQAEFVVTYRKHRTAYQSNRGQNAPYDLRLRVHFSIPSSTHSPMIEPSGALSLVHSGKG